jgi:hypothetical protein
MVVLQSPVFRRDVYTHIANNKSTICRNWLGLLIILQAATHIHIRDGIPVRWKHVRVFSLWKSACVRYIWIAIKSNITSINWPSVLCYMHARLSWTGVMEMTKPSIVDAAWKCLWRRILLFGVHMSPKCIIFNLKYLICPADICTYMTQHRHEFSVVFCFISGWKVFQIGYNAIYTQLCFLITPRSCHPQLFHIIAYSLMLLS